MRNTSCKKIFSGALGLLFILLGLYITQIISLTAKAYAMTASEAKFTQLETTNKTLQSNRAKNLTMQNFSALAVKLGFEKITTISYIQTVGTSVAKR